MAYWIEFEGASQYASCDGEGEGLPLKGAADWRKFADTLYLFRDMLNPKRYTAIPVVSFEEPKYMSP